MRSSGPAASGNQRAGATVPLLVLDRFEAAFDNVSTTNYKATASSAENRPIAFTWKMQYVAGRCGNFTVYGASNPSDLGNAQQATVPGILNSDGYFVSTAAYNHEGCPFAIEANEVLVLDVVRTDLGKSCQLEYVQKARDDDEPSKPKEFPPTVKTGTCTEETKPPPPPPPPLNAAPPTIPKKQKQEWRDQALLLDAAAGTSASAALLLLVVPEPASKGGAAIMLVVAVGELAASSYYAYKAKDPPDPNFKRLAKPVYPQPALLRASGGITKAEAAAANAWLANTARLAGLDRAFITSFERAQGAYRARNAVWDRRQSTLAAKFARAEAKVLDARPAIEAALRRALGAADLSRRVVSAKGSSIRPARGLPAATISLLRSFGVRRAEIAAFQKKLAKTSPSSTFVPPRLAAADRSGVRLLRALAARLARR